MVKKTLISIALGMTSCLGLAISPPSARAEEKTAAQSTDFDARARQIVAQMTLDEKIAQLHGIKDKNNFRVVPGLPRLGIPALTVANGPAGVGPAGPGHQGKATALLAPIALAATWDIDAARTDGELAGSEAAALGNLLLESPDINIARTPHNGRTFEGFGEDPFLAGQLAAPNVQGIQSQGVIANVKHYDANNQEQNRHKVNEIIDERTLREIYLPAFEASVKQGHVGSVMGAYNQVNGEFSCENAFLLNQVLKGDWAFDGFVTSDFGAVHSTVPSARNGLDLEMPTGIYFGDALKKAVNRITAIAHAFKLWGDGRESCTLQRLQDDIDLLLNLFLFGLQFRKVGLVLFGRGALVKHMLRQSSAKVGRILQRRRE